MPTRPLFAMFSNRRYKMRRGNDAICHNYTIAGHTVPMPFTSRSCVCSARMRAEPAQPTNIHPLETNPVSFYAVDESVPTFLVIFLLRACGLQTMMMCECRLRRRCGPLHKRLQLREHEVSNFLKHTIDGLANN